MSYMLLIVENSEQRRARAPSERMDLHQRMQTFDQQLKARGLYLASNALVADADTVRVETRGGRRVVHDGPFAEAKELVGGYFLIDCATREQAVAIAAECPASAWATIEVRKVGDCFDA